MLNNRNGIEEMVYVIIKEYFIMQITCCSSSLLIFHISHLLMFAQIIQCGTWRVSVAIFSAFTFTKIVYQRSKALLERIQDLKNVYMYVCIYYFKINGQIYLSLYYIKLKKIFF